MLGNTGQALTWAGRATVPRLKNRLGAGTGGARRGHTANPTFLQEIRMPQVGSQMAGMGFGGRPRGREDLSETGLVGVWGAERKACPRQCASRGHPSLGPGEGTHQAGALQTRVRAR